MRDDYDKFQKTGVRIVVVTKASAEKVKSYFKENKLPYIGLPDPDAKIAKIYHQQWKLAKLGLMPAMFLIDRSGKITYLHYSKSMSDIPTNVTVLEEIGKLSPSNPDN